MYKILFVCTGNICRSPTADGILQHYIKTHDLSDRLMSDSAGLYGYHVGESPNARSTATANSYGIHLNHLRARQFHADDYERFDLILGMDQGHYEQLYDGAPETHRNKVKLFLPYTKHPTLTCVPDPYYGTEKDFEYAFHLINDGITALIKRVPL